MNEPTGLLDMVRVIYTRVEAQGEKLEEIDTALRGSKDGTIVGFAEQARTNSFCIRKIKEEQKAMRAEIDGLREETIDKPREERRSDVRGIITMGLGGALTVALGWIAAKMFGGK